MFSLDKKENHDYHCILQKSSNMILIIGKDKQETLIEYNNTYQEDKSLNDFDNSFYSNHDIVLLSCTKFLYDKVLSSSDYVDYFFNGIELDTYIETVEDLSSSIS